MTSKFLFFSVIFLFGISSSIAQNPISCFVRGKCVGDVFQVVEDVQNLHQCMDLCSGKPTFKIVIHPKNFI